MENKKYETSAGIELTPRQNKLVEDFEKLMTRWEKDGKNLAINAIAGDLLIMLVGDTEQNPIPEMSDVGGFNDENRINHKRFNVLSDGGDW